ncbi:hypothetical protein PG996_011828 [Apiospora saccharicola]|uniref:Uncharacterized protein n=1 Tax=Apiospora saccharicola TaxID=335842 RepID=A0ABR1UIG9_9PEZI
MSFKANEVPDDQADKLVDTLEEKVSMSLELFSGNMLRQRCGSELEVLGIDTNRVFAQRHPSSVLPHDVLTRRPPPLAWLSRGTSLSLPTPGPSGSPIILQEY